MNILIFISDRVGDIIFCTPAFHLIKEIHPASTVSVFSPTTMGKTLLINNPYVDNVFEKMSKRPKNIDILIDWHDCRESRKVCALLKLPINKITEFPEQPIALNYLNHIYSIFEIKKNLH